MSVVPEMEAANAAYAEKFTHSGQPKEPSRRVAVVTCMDARIDLYRTVGLGLGEAHVIRNAGGVMTDDVIRSLAISQQALGTREILVIHHTNCGMEGMDEAGFAQQLESRTGTRPEWPELAFDDVRENARRSVKILTENPFIEYTESITGYVYDVNTGLLEKV